MPNVKETQTIIETIIKMSAAEKAVLIVLLVGVSIGSIRAYNWVENRYAKMVETKASIEKTEQEIRKHKTEILQISVRSFEILKQYPTHTQDQINKNIKDFMDQYKSLEETKGK